MNQIFSQLFLLNAFFFFFSPPSFLNYKNWRCQPRFDIDVTVRWVGLQGSWREHVSFSVHVHPAWRVVEREGRAEHSLLLYEAYSRSSAVPTVGLFFCPWREYEEECLVLWLKARFRKPSFFWAWFCVVLLGCCGLVGWLVCFSTDFPHERHSLCPSSVFLNHGW